MTADPAVDIWADAFIDPFDAYQQPLRRIRGGIDIRIHAASFEIDPPLEDVTVMDDREMQQRHDDGIGERWGYEPGVRRCAS